MRQNYSFPEELQIESLALTDNMFNYLGFYLGINEDDRDEEDELECPDLTEVENLKLIDLWLKLANVSMSTFILLCSYYEDGGSQNSHGYSYSKEIINSDMEAYLLENLNASVFAKQMIFESEEYAISIDVACEYNQNGKERYIVDLFHLLDPLYRESNSFETTHWIYDE